MEWRRQSVLSCEAAYSEAQRWIEAVTKQNFGSSNFRSSLENGVLLCDLINKINPGIIKKFNRPSTPIAGLDNLNLFLKACAKLGLKEAQLFHPGDLQDLSTRVTVKHQESSRRLKNVLITIYWLGRKAYADPFYNGPYLKLKEFEGLLGTALYKALEDSSSLRGSVREGSYTDGWYSEKEELYSLRAGHRREDSLDSLDSLGSRTNSTSSDTTLKGSEGCGSDPEADLAFMMTDNKEYRRSLVITPKTTTQFNQFLPSKDKQTGYVPAPLRKKRAEQNEDNRRSWGGPLYTEADGSFTSQSHEKARSGPSPIIGLKSCAYEYESSDSDADRPDPDVVLDDLASRRFHSPSPVAPTNFALPMSPEAAAVPRTTWAQVSVTNVPRQTLTPLSSQSESPQRTYRRPVSADVCTYDDSEEEDDEFGYADPVQDDLYARKVGLSPQPSATVPYDKFLPKFWTPEEDAHVKKIKLGSQRRPWYRKIQGFSHRKSGSSSEDSDGDVSPWLSVPSFSRTQSEPPPSHSHALGGPAYSSLTSTSSSQIQPPMGAQQTAGLPKLEPPDFWPGPDPTSGPRLIKCEKRPLLGREHPNDPYNVSADILPDLENDDMFTRRTNAFHSSDELAKLKYGNFLVPRRRSETDVTVVTQPRSEAEPVYPDIEKDDLVFRRVQQQTTQRPLSGAPDKYHPVPIPEPWTLPPKLQAKLMCSPYEPRHRDPEPGRKQAVEQHLKTDDMLLRKLRALNTQGTANITGSTQSAAQRGPSVPSSCSEEDMQKWQAIREASRVKYRKRLLVERMILNSSGSDEGSKSVNDITDDQAELISVSKEVRYDELKKMREKLKENEDKWQDDLTRWKNKRKSVNSDIVKKKEEREHIELLTSGSSRKSKTFKEMQDGREGREQGSFRNSLNSFVDDVFEEPTPRSRTLPARSYTIDTPYAPVDKPSVSSVPSVWEDEPTAGTLASDQTDYPAKRERSIPDIQRNMKNQSSTSLIKPTSTITPTSPSKPTNTSTVFNSSQQLPSFSNAKPVESSSGPISSLYKPISMETKQPGLDRVSASLPRSYQKSDSTRLTSVVTPRPFGTQANRVTSLPRTFTTDNSYKRMNGETDKKPTVPSRYAAYMTEEEALSQDSPLHSSDEEEEEEEEERVSSGPQTPSPVPPVNRVPPLRKAASPVSPPNENTQAEYSEMRISLNQKPNSSQGFGFQTDWDSTGARVKSVVAGSPAELSQVKVGDEILTVNGHRVAEMSYKEWKNSLEEALQEGSLFMDIRRHGQNSSPEPHLSTNLNLTSHQAKDTIVKTVNVSSQSGNNIGSNGINGGFRDELGNPNKESESISSKNLKRRSEFFEQGGSETAISNLPMPTVSAPSNRWSWDPEEERRRQEKWQKEQERMLQEKYKKDQEKLDEEWRKAQQEFAKDSSKNHKEQIISLEQDRYSPYSPLSSNRQSTPTWEEQEVSRLAQQLEEQKKREQERQRLEEERRKRQEKERLEEERKKREEEERFRQENERRKQEEERKRLEEQRRLQEQDNVDSYGYTNVYPELSYSHRAISKSTPELDEFAKPDIKGVYNQHRGMAGWLLEQELRRKKNAQIQRQIAASQLEFERRNILNAMKYREPERASGGLGEVGRDNKKEPLSQAELERQQIIQEMKKKTNLNRDSSWIRQQPPSTTTTRDPIDLPIRRGESLDNLDMPRTSWRSSWSTSGSTSSIPDYNRPQSALSSSSTSYRAGRPGSATMQASQSMSSLRQSWSPSPPASTTSPEPEPQAPPKNRSVSGRKICSLCKSPLGKGAAMIIESLGLCYHLGCFKCIDCRADLGGSEAGAEVRIRNQQLYCNACYTRLKGGQPTSM